MAATHIESLDGGRMLVEESWAAVLRANGLDAVTKLMALQSGKVERAVPGRSTVRLELAVRDGTRIAVYLKRFDPEYLSLGRALLRFLRWPGADDEALREWRKIFQLRRHGFVTAPPVAVGQLRRAGIVTHSLVMTQEITGGIPADQYFQSHLRAGPLRRKWAWLAAVGRFARHFQEARFIHKDFYLSHIFVVEEGEDWRFHLIDLQRVRGPRWHLSRWYLKDLIALTFSARIKARCSRPDMLRLYKAYARRVKLSTKDKQIIRRLWRRARKLERRPPRYRRVWNRPPDPPLP
jgi:hypothetical protein